MASISVELLINKITALIDELQEQQDDYHTVKLKQLHEKLQNHHLSIALCGHFSAGKSTLINTLCEAKLLPSSPIPTSANVVTLSYGEQAQAEVEILHNGVTRFDIVPIEKLADYCVDGESYTSVNINYPSAFLKQGIKLLDTPGIDSTDDAHRMSTESALHLADVVFYVMDYNHVQSEINFSFAKQLKEWGKPLYFIVNQIDKHREEELSFEQYSQSVWDAFQAWHLEPAGIIYLSLKSPDHPKHQWDSLVQLSEALVKQAEPLKLESVKASLKHIINEHIEANELMGDEKLELSLKAMGGKEKVEAVVSQMDELKQSEKQLLQRQAEIVPLFRQELDSILKNANITPAELRDKMASFLESRKPGFKQGLIFTKAKTENEQQQRLHHVYEHLVELVKSNIEWHVLQALRSFLKAYNIEPTVLDGWLVKLEDSMPQQDWLIEQISSGAVFDNAYTLTYCSNISEGIKRSYREQTISILEAIVEVELANLFLPQVNRIKEELHQLEQQLIGAESYFKLKEEQAQYRRTLLGDIHPIVLPTALSLPAVSESSGSSTNQQSFVEQKQLINIAQSFIQQELELGGLEQVNALKKHYHTVSEKLVDGAQLLEQHEQLHPLAERLLVKAERLKKLNFTISLFGAFSAGKSSLANALIGDAVLPVSPNPTTAAINSILPPDDQHAHNTATIFMKTEQVMLDDLVYSLKLLGLYPYEDVLSKDKLFALIDKIKPSDVANSGRAHYSFVKAARKGWATEGQHLGQLLNVTKEAYVQYVAEEHLSCFVQEIKFYYDCPLTATGIILVDTPGADSVNARHTGVAFNYIKNTDAIIFVTYYNHAFSHADRQFLDQLGRVKDQFELDKMFFVVNAADLAASEEELQGVLKHVETNLESHNIKNARLYPISSIMALEAKQTANNEQLNYSGMYSFEQQFYSFIQMELGQMVVKAAEQEYVTVYEEVKQLFTNAKRDLAQKDEHITRLQQTENSLHAYIELRRQQPIPDSLKQEVSELTYYIVQRLQLRFTDFYNYAINPSVIKEDGRSLQHTLYTAWLELERTLAMELKQELLATTLRLEKYSNRLIEEQATFVRKWLEEHELPYQWSTISHTFEQPTEQKDWALSSISSKWLWSYFKSAKHFFEQQGKQQLRAELEPLIFQSIKEWMLATNETWLVYYEEQYKQAYSQTLQFMLQDSSRYIAQAIKMLNDETYMKQIERIVDKLKQLND